MPALTGTKKTGPAFSFGVKKTAHFISKEYLKVKTYTLLSLQNFQGRDSGPIRNGQPLLKAIHGVVIPREGRFRESTASYKKTL